MGQRRVVTGVRDGREVVVSDEILPVTVLAAVEVVNLWRCDAVPTVANDGTAPPAEDLRVPPAGAFWVCHFTVAPETTIQYDEPLVELESGRPRFHATDSVDVDTITQGTIVMEMEDGMEVTLDTGDVIVVNGTGHAWHNRRDVPATVLAAVYGARRA